MNKYEKKQADRKSRYALKAEKLREESEQIYNHSKKKMELIPLGQPILVGHHSEGRHRNFLKRNHARLLKAVELDKKAAHYERRANLTNHAISSDDEDAIHKIKEKLARLEKHQETMKTVNKYYAKHKKLPDDLTNPEREDTIAASWDKKPFPSYALSNNSAEIRRSKQRIKILERERSLQPREDIQGEGLIIQENKEDNRICIIFDQIPIESTRIILKKNGFKWSPSRKAWVRMLNNAGRYATEQVLQQLGQLILKLIKG